MCFAPIQNPSIEIHQSNSKRLRANKSWDTQMLFLHLSTDGSNALCGSGSQGTSVLLFGTITLFT